MLLNNLGGWFQDPLSWHQLISWALLIISLVLVIQGVRLLRTIGRKDEGRSDPRLLGMEKTSQLVTIGLYRYIRHPLYSSLLFLALLCTIFLTATARVEEHENVIYFGAEYEEYIHQSKMFIPFII